MSRKRAANEGNELVTKDEGSKTRRLTLELGSSGDGHVEGLGRVEALEVEEVKGVLVGEVAEEGATETVEVGRLG